MKVEPDIKLGLARNNLKFFAEYINSNLVFKPVHDIVYNIVDLFAHKKIKKLIITLQPQIGKSELSTRILSSFVEGIYPDTKIAIGSYNATFARKFNRDIQRIIDSDKYKEVFPDTKLNSGNENFIRNVDEFEIVNHKGSVKTVGRGGSLTGNPVDLMIMDDLYKDYSEGNSPVIRETAWDWYISVVRTRLHNDSQQLIVFTRWHEDDIIGRLEKTESVITVNSWAELKAAMSNKDAWIKINFEAIKETEKTPFDPRELGDVLWPEKHSIEKLIEDRKLNPIRFECLHQGKPSSKEGALYSDFDVWEVLPENIIAKNNYTDVADTGTDYLCSICYVKDKANNIYVTDILYTQKPNEYTEIALPEQLNRMQTQISYIESNNGGRGFARVVQQRVKLTKIVPFVQSQNKESRILTNSASVTRFIKMPFGWESRFPEFFTHITTFKRLFAANKHKDCADVLTGIIEKEILANNEFFII